MSNAVSRSWKEEHLDSLRQPLPYAEETTSQIDAEEPDDRRRAITVDWIVVMASVVGLMVVLAASIQAGDTGIVSQLVSGLSISLNGM